METSNERKPYRAPQITRVILRKEQAILSACYTGTTSASSNSASHLCQSRTTRCRRFSSGASSNVS
ncbi:MAG TPA: hypothetical protein VMU17_04235 [Elusimicrobiota bacterium]|nr:hypothetical protein [Elusimicrobiota bacterium]